MSLPDIQDQVDERGVELDQVGISNLRMPTTFTDGEVLQTGIATFDVTVTLPTDRRGTHMSRMVELVQERFSSVDPRALGPAMKHAAAKLEVDRVRVSMAMPFAVAVTSPASRRESWQASDLVLDVSVDGDRLVLLTSVTTQVTSLCPCSKAVSDYGAHNQRSDVRVQVTGTGDAPYVLTVSRLVSLIRATGSCPVYPMVKRPDERSITMTAFDHPAFVEDMIRDLSVALRDLEAAHTVEVRNLESIHSHDAIARVNWPTAG